MSQSKLDDLISNAVAETRTVEAPECAKAEALRALRHTEGRTSIRPHRHWPLVAALAGIAVIALVALPRPSEAAALLSILKRTQAGIVHSVVFSNGVKTMESYQNGDVAKLITAQGGEQLFEAGRSWTRHREGYITVQDGSASEEFLRGPSLRRFLEKDTNERVRKLVMGGFTRFAVEGEFVDGQGATLRYKAAMDVDKQSRPIRQTSEVEGFGTTTVEWTYGGTAEDLKLTPVAADRVYDLDSQRRALMAKLESVRPGKEQVIGAYLDEMGQLGVLVSVPKGVFPRNQPAIVDGRPRPSLNLAFNTYAGFPSSVKEEWNASVAQAKSGNSVAIDHTDLMRSQLELDAPVPYKNLNVVLRTVKMDVPPKTPFTLQFPFWKGDPAVTFQHPVIRDGKVYMPSLASHKAFVVEEVERTSSLSYLLSPMNVPFWQTSGQSGQVSKAVEK